MAKTTIVLVNPVKEQRAKYIIALLGAHAVLRTDGDEDDQRKFGAILAEAGMKPDAPEAVQFVYEKLGGLVRTHEEQEQFDENVAEQKKSKGVMENENPLGRTAVTNRKTR